MRFGFKTSPQNTTWADMLAVWKAADDIELFESGWTFDHFYPIFSDSTGPCMGGGGEKRTLRSVARWADHWNVAGGSVDDFRRKHDVLRQHCADIGRDPTEILTSTHLRLAPGGEPKEVAEQATAFAEAGLDMG